MLINENLIVLNLNAKDKNDAILELAALAHKDGKIISIDEYIESVFEREKSYSTGVGNGIAIPHGKSKAVKEAMIVFGKLAGGIEWDSLDDKPVDLIFLLGVPDQNVDNLHLKILSQLSRKLMNDDFIELLRNAKTSSDVMTVLSDIKVS
jgi:fructose PTS system EIIA component